MANLARVLESSLPYLVMTLCQFALAVHMSLQKAVIFDGVSPIVLALYQQIVGVFVLCGLAIFFESGKRPALSFDFLAWAFLIGFLQNPCGGVLVTVSLRYVSIVITTVANNMIPTVIFVLTIFTGQEAFKCRSLIGLGKLLSIVSSAVGATMLFFFSNPGALHEDSVAKDGWWFGCFLVGTSVLAFSSAAILLEKVGLKYEADFTLSVTITSLGILQTLVVAIVMERRPSSWKIKWFSLQFLTILHGVIPYPASYSSWSVLFKNFCWGLSGGRRRRLPNKESSCKTFQMNILRVAATRGIFIGGLGYLFENWCIRTRGPVFANAFSPLLIVFSFLLQILLFGSDASIWSIASALLVICGLYLLLWAKSKENAKIDGKNSSETSNIVPLLVNTTV